MDNPNPVTLVIFCTDVAGKHYWTHDEMFLPMDSSIPLDAAVKKFPTHESADREVAAKAAQGIHLRRSHCLYTEIGAAR